MDWLIEHQQQLSHQIEQGKLPHAILLCGVQGSGKSKLAQWLTGVVSCLAPSKDHYGVFNPCQCCKHCLLINGQTYPDIEQLTPENDSHKVDAIRAACQFLQKTPQLGNKQVVVIEQADKMNAASSNALLKTLEEPSASSMLLLLTDNKSQLLETVISRCQTIDIKPFVGQKLAQIYQLNSQDPYLNISHLKQFSTKESIALTEQLQNHFLLFLAGEYSLMAMAKDLNETDESLAIIYQLVAKLIRQANGWYEPNQCSEYQQVKAYASPASLLAINTLLLKTIGLNHQVQTNRALQTEKCLVSVQQLLNNNKN
ncbi:hypothetical protein LP316_10805 [Thalassotalea sp. LPB0316]|uniref:hypothetical protein n=1 Tax=Thalassotalea sp. LPB0316 TaxID=2769490 RepID=UPI001866F91A|nr:hypothetical protein [Thalassotalea sp. LPB0316]QOL24812.1 hypothetical protein LP316_10805 [Thalassotalea sp. LPB0316]